ncbi:uncharacterized protein UV8b_01860 [Ustilaginoidea virens]|uniref:Uncharacterized protein n=1 Tax=Ustilaginoidea virens TaxID=1159556 RepID=A0A8E5HLK0_USTVR|nr:uncharacterized protein UV8b_01860 [Ustilaginoidea virens]QUC17619.1 hypothetical protein UV8b_01860 [Ustilaginoidea virens]
MESVRDNAVSEETGPAWVKRASIQTLQAIEEGSIPGSASATRFYHLEYGIAMCPTRRQVEQDQDHDGSLRDAFVSAQPD